MVVLCVCAMAITTQHTKFAQHATTHRTSLVRWLPPIAQTHSVFCAMGDVHKNTNCAQMVYYIAQFVFSIFFINFILIFIIIIL